MDKLVVIAGETSSDLIGGQIVTNLRHRYPNLTFCGIAGPAMRAAGVTPWFTTESFSVMGFSDVLKKALFLIFALRKTCHSIVKSGARAVITIDQPSFSIACAKRLRAMGYTGTIIQVVAPTVWAYKPSRADTIAQYFDLLLVLYRFELDYFKKIPCIWVGHPLISSLPKNNQTEKTTLALFPGSRPGEIKRNLPLQLDAAALILKDFPHLQLCISISEAMSPAMLQFISATASKKCPSFTLVPFNDRYTLMQAAKAALTKSGTVTLELALLGVPFVCCYKVGFLTEMYVKYILKLRPMSFALPNILTNTHSFPECIIPPVSPKAIKRLIVPYISGETQLPDLHALLDQIDPKEPPGERMATAIARKIGLT